MRFLALRARNDNTLINGQSKRGLLVHTKDLVPTCRALLYFVIACHSERSEEPHVLFFIFIPSSARNLIHYIARNFITFSTTIINLSSNASFVANPICGNNIVFGAVSNGFSPLNGGSPS